MRPPAVQSALQPYYRLALYKTWGRVGLSAIRPAGAVLTVLLVGVGAGGCPDPIDPVTSLSLSSILAKAPSPRDRLQPPEPRPIRINVTTAPAGPIADRPMRSHVLYRASPHGGCNALWDAGGRNSELLT